MPLEKIGTILKDATKNKYGVAAFNVVNYESIAWAVETANDEKMPVIIQFYPNMNNFIPFNIVAMITREAARKASVPVALHLDHSYTYDIIVTAIKDGFPSVMVDGSQLSFEENVKITRKVAEHAHAADVNVEAELGFVGAGRNLEDYTDEANFTDPDQAAEFIRSTGADTLAVSIGNSHGHYVETPNLDFDRLKRIRIAVDVPLVLHGGSDIPDEQVRQAVRLGISKVNIATEYSQAFYNAVQNNLKTPIALKYYMYGVLSSAESPVKEFVASKIRLLNPEGYKVI